MSTAPATSGTTVNYGIRLNSNRMTLMTGVVVLALEGFWGLTGGLSLLAAAFAAVYLVTYWSGFRGGDRAMVRRPAIEGPVPASVAD